MRNVQLASYQDGRKAERARLREAIEQVRDRPLTHREIVGTAMTARAMAFDEVLDVLEEENE